MIIVNNKKLDIELFPDGTQKIKPNSVILLEETVKVDWFYENDSELFTLQCLSDYLDEHNIEKECLYIPYVPNARMDRVEDDTDVFTLKTFCRIINGMNFKKVLTFCVHSNITKALLNNCEDKSVYTAIHFITSTMFKTDVIFLPDEGAYKRFSKDLKKLEIPFAYGMKVRNFQTGKIEKLDIYGADVNNKNVLVVDDICSKGGTFVLSANKLKQMGAKTLSLFVTHCENTIADGELLKPNSPYDKIYTTDSICTIEDDRLHYIVRNEIRERSKNLV